MKFTKGTAMTEDQQGQAAMVLAVIAVLTFTLGAVIDNAVLGIGGFVAYGLAFFRFTS